jgi:hypothetical protein
MAGTGRTSWRGATESWRARLSRACGGGGVDREPVRNPESRPTTNESWRAQVSIRACGATQPASKERLRRYSTRGTVRAERYPTRIPEATPRGAGRRRSEGGGFRYAPAALLNPRAGAACGATRPAGRGGVRRCSTRPPDATSRGAGARSARDHRSAGGRRAGFDTRPRRYSTRGTGGDLRHYSTREQGTSAALLNPRDGGRPAALLNRLGGAVCCGPRSAWVCCIVRRLRAVGECFT